MLLPFPAPGRYVKGMRVVWGITRSKTSKLREAAMFHRRAVIASLSGLCLAAPALAQAPAWPTTLFPDLPTVAERGLLAPARVPEAIQRRFHAALGQSAGGTRITHAADRALGIDVVRSTPEDFSTFLKAQMVLLGRVVRENNIGQNRLVRYGKPRFTTLSISARTSRSTRGGR
jgi:hypothetical protein